MRRKQKSSSGTINGEVQSKESKKDNSEPFTHFDYDTTGKSNEPADFVLPEPSPVAHGNTVTDTALLFDHQLPEPSPVVEVKKYDDIAVNSIQKCTPEESTKTEAPNKFYLEELEDDYIHIEENINNDNRVEATHCTKFNVYIEQSEPCPPGEDVNSIDRDLMNSAIESNRHVEYEVTDVLKDELVEQEIMNASDSTQDCMKEKNNEFFREIDDMEPPGEEEIEMLTEIPVIRIRSRSNSSSSSSSRSSYSSRSRSRSTSRRRSKSELGGRSKSRCSSRNSYSTDDDIEIIEDTNAISEKTVDKNIKSANSSCKDNNDEEIEVELEYVKNQTTERKSRWQAGTELERPIQRNANQHCYVRSSKTDPIHDQSGGIYRFNNDRPGDQRNKWYSRKYGNWSERRAQRDTVWSTIKTHYSKGAGDNNSNKSQKYQDPNYKDSHGSYSYQNDNNDYSGISDGCNDFGSEDQYQYDHYESKMFSATNQSSESRHNSQSKSNSESKNLCGLPANTTRFLNQQILRPGKYLLVTWDMEAAGGSIYQLGGWSGHGDHVHCMVTPQLEADLQRAKHHPDYPLVVMAGSQFVRHANSGQFLQAVTEGEAIFRFMRFLETCKNRTRPAYDGVVLVSHNSTNVSMFLKTFKKYKMYVKLSQLVSAIGDINKYLRSVDSSKCDFSFARLYESVLRRPMYPRQPMGDDKTRLCHEILNKLFEGGTNYNNFYKMWCQPLHSASIESLVNLKTVEEKEEMFQHMEESITRQLVKEQIEYNHHDPDIRRKDSPAHVSRSIIQLLVASGFQFEQLMLLVQNKGLGVLELELRTGFLKQMSGLSRTLVDRSVMGTRLVVEYFRMYGNMSLNQITGVRREAESYQEQQSPHHGQDRPEYLTQCRNFTQLEAFLFRKFDRSPELRQACQLSIKILEDNKFTPDFLIERHRAGGHNNDWFTSHIEGIKVQFPTANVHVISRSISDWCQEQVGLGVRSRKEIDR